MLLLSFALAIFTEISGGLVSSNCLCRYGTIISCYYNKTRERNGADGLVTLLDRPWTSSRM